MKSANRLYFGELGTNLKSTAQTQMSLRSVDSEKLRGESMRTKAGIVNIHRQPFAIRIDRANANSGVFRVSLMKENEVTTIHRQ